MSRVVEYLDQCPRTRIPVIAVHDGKFHPDELVAVALVISLGYSVNVVRSRDPKVLDAADLVFDVGGDCAGKYFDHHQRSFQTKHPNGTKYAATGLVWDDIQEEFLSYYLPNGTWYNKNLLANKVMRALILPIDASDNGETGELNPLTPLKITDVINAMNQMDPKKQDEAFLQALHLVRGILDTMIAHWLEIVAEDDRIYREMLDQKGREVFFLEKFGPWISAAVNHWEDCQTFKVCVFPDATHKDEWRVQTFPASKENTFEQRCSAPEDLKGYREGTSNKILSQNVIFVHPAGFIGGVRGTKEDALAFARHWVNHTSTPPAESE